MLGGSRGWAAIAGGVLLAFSLLGALGVVPLATVLPCPASDCGPLNAEPTLSVGFVAQQSGHSVNVTDRSAVRDTLSYAPLPGWTVSSVSVSWGDGTSNRSGPGSTAHHTYASPGTYVITEKVGAVGPGYTYACASKNLTTTVYCTNNETLSGAHSYSALVPPACAAQSCQITSTGNWSLSASFTWRTSGLSATLTAVIEDQNVTVMSSNVAFTFGDGSPNVTASAFTSPASGSTVHTFPAAGSYEVTLRVAGAPYGGFNSAPTQIATVTHVVNVSQVRNSTGPGPQPASAGAVGFGGTVELGAGLFGLALLAVAVAPGGLPRFTAVAVLMGSGVVVLLLGITGQWVP